MTSTSAQDLQEELLTNIRKGQHAIVYAIRTWAETVRAVTSKLPGVSVPFGDKLPSPQEAVDSAYQLAEQLLVNQRKFAEDVLKVTAPLMPGNSNDNSVTAPRVARSEPKAAPVTPAPAPRATFVVPAPKAPVAKVEPKLTAVVPAPKAPVAKVESKPAPVVPAAPVAKSESVTPTPKAAAPKAAAPQAAATKTAATKTAATKTAATKTAATKTAATKSTAKATSAASAPRTTAAKSAPRTTAKRATPKAADAN